MPDLAAAGLRAFVLGGEATAVAAWGNSNLDIATVCLDGIFFLFKEKPSNENARAAKHCLWTLKARTIGTVDFPSLGWKN